MSADEEDPNYIYVIPEVRGSEMQDYVVGARELEKHLNLVHCNVPIQDVSQHQAHLGMIRMLVESHPFLLLTPVRRNRTEFGLLNCMMHKCTTADSFHVNPDTKHMQGP